MYTYFSPSVPSSLRGTEARKLRRSLFFSDGTETCRQRATALCLSVTDVRRHKSRKARTNMARQRWQIGTPDKLYKSCFGYNEFNFLSGNQQRGLRGQKTTRQQQKWRSEVHTALGKLRLQSRTQSTRRSTSIVHIV